MDDETIRRIWFDFVRANYHRLKSAVGFISSKEGFFGTRDIMAQMGKEITPKELDDLKMLIESTIEQIDEEENK